MHRGVPLLGAFALLPIAAGARDSAPPPRPSFLGSSGSQQAGPVAAADDVGDGDVPSDAPPLAPAVDGSDADVAVASGAAAAGANGSARRRVMPRDPSRGQVTNMPLPRYVSLKSSEGNVRRGPGLSHRIDWVFRRSGMPLKITAEYEHWRRVEDADGMGGWVNFSLLSGVRSVLVTQNMAEFRGRPDDNAAVTFKAEANVIGKLLQCQPDWCRIGVEGEKGWVRKTALWGVDPTEVLD
jgi:SH3-like domain-containing protein